REQHCGGNKQTDGLTGSPTCLVAIDDSVDGKQERRGDGDGTCDVEARGSCGTATGRQQDEGECDHGNAYRQVHEKDPVPIERIRQNATKQYADASPASSNEAEESHRLGSLGWLSKQGHDQREGDSRDDSAAESLDRPGRDEES